MGETFEIGADLPAVRRRIEAECAPIESLWFPSRAAQDRWYRGGRLYIRWLSADLAEVGPCVGTLVSARFLPVVDLHVSATAGRTTLRLGRRHWPLATQVIGGIWVAILIAWAVALNAAIASGAERPAIAVFWVVLAGATLGGGAFGARYGTSELDRRLPALRAAAENEGLEQEDW
jgi:hypothetical protein